MLDYEVIKTGSSGNCTVIENIMIDLGVSYSMIREELYNIDYLLITHIHSDHIHTDTYSKLRKFFPNIITISNYQVAKKLNGDIDYVINWGEKEEFDDITFEAFEAPHNVYCNGYTFSINKDDETYDIIYATDCTDYSHAPDKQYDYMFLESNYDTEIMNAIHNPRATYGYDVKKNASRHCSTQVCKGFYYSHRRSEKSKLIELHMSSRFYR